MRASSAAGARIAVMARYSLMGAKLSPKTIEAKKRVLAAFSEQIKHVIAAHKVPEPVQVELSARSRLGEGPISRLINGKTMPDLVHLARLAAAIGCEPEELVPSQLVAAFFGEKSIHR
jgi:transcriptional regulator with XRE-family HTH domain